MGTKQNSNNGNGVAVISAAQLLPAFVTFEVAGTAVNADHKVVTLKDGINTRIDYRADVYFDVEDPGTDRAELLNSLPVEVPGCELSVLKPGAHVSNPRLYGKNHAKAGQKVPGYGGNWTCCWTGSLDIAGHGYTIAVWVTILDRPATGLTEARCSFTAKPLAPARRHITVGSI